MNGQESFTIPVECQRKDRALIMRMDLHTLTVTGEDNRPHDIYELSVDLAGNALVINFFDIDGGNRAQVVIPTHPIIRAAAVAIGHSAVEFIDLAAKQRQERQLKPAAGEPDTQNVAPRTSHVQRFS